MKKILLAVTLAVTAGSALAQWNPPPGNPMPPTNYSVWPTVRNYGSHAQIWVNNPNTRTVWCSGSLSMYMDGPDNRVHTAMVSLNVFPRGYAQRAYYPNSSGRIQRVTHNIWCR